MAIAIAVTGKDAGPVPARRDSASRTPVRDTHIAPGTGRAPAIRQARVLVKAIDHHPASEGADDRAGRGADRTPVTGAEGADASPNHSLDNP